MTKFEPLSKYESGRGKGYQLLPFQFIELDDARYVLTNLTGEYHVASRATLDKFAAHELDASAEDYKALKSKHFLMDADSSVALDLLALKTRTKYERLSNFTGLHLFVVTLRCEHSCPYCQVSRQNDNKTEFDMTRETADRAIELVFRSPSPDIKIEFQGGEPLLNFPIIQYVVERASARNETAKRNLGFVIATNLAVITDEILVFCRRHSVHISTSHCRALMIESFSRRSASASTKTGLHSALVNGLCKVRVGVYR